MRKILLTLLCVSLVCASAFAFWNPFNRSTKPTFNEAEPRATLAELAPTEAEAEAIAALRKKSSVIQRAMQPKEYALVLPSDWKLPVEAEPVDDENVQIRIHYQFISGRAELTRKVIGHPAMEWSPLPVADQFTNADAPANGAVNAVNTQIPIQIRYLEQDNVQKFFQFFHSQRAACVLETPSLILENGQAGTIQDTTTIPFVTNVMPVVADNMVVYQPIITKIHQGMTTQIQATLLQDGSCRLTSQLSINNVTRVDTYKLIDDGTTDVVSQNGRNITKTTRSINIQVPSFHTFRANIPDIVIPEGMSLLVAFPGAEMPYWFNNRNDNATYEAFMLITPTKVTQ